MNTVSVFAKNCLRIAGSLLLFVALLVWQVPVTAQTISSFSESSTAFVNYSATNERPVRACSSLVSLSGADYSIVSAALIPGTPEVPEHCRVAGVIPAEIRFEVNMPTRWNARLYMPGTDGFAGRAPEDQRAGLASALRHGFATVATDTGHDARTEPGGSFAYNNLAKLIDYGFRGVHLTALTAKVLLARYYEQGPSYSYFNGCSNGGRQAMMEAQRFPTDFAGIIAGAPSLNYTGTKISQLHKARAMKDRPVSSSELEILAASVYAKCDGIDGLHDGIIDDPRKCDFRVAEELPLCDSEDTDACFAEYEIEAIEAIYSPVVLGGDVVLRGHTLSGEAVSMGFDGVDRPGWIPWIVSEDGESLNEMLGGDFWRYLAFLNDDPDYDWLNHDMDEVPDNLANVAAITNATNPDLTAFRDEGGKLISYYGWAEPALNPLQMIDYREAVADEMGNDLDEFFRLFMVPGMAHCRGGVGPDSFDAMTALIDWVEGNIEPDSIIASQIVDGEIIRTRPLCPYPKVAMHQGFGSIDEAANFACEH